MTFKCQYQHFAPGRDGAVRYGMPMTRVGTAAQSKAERTRRAIIEAALKRFSDRGVAATTIAEIVADVGVTERTFYRYFANKEEILFVDYQDRIDWFRSALQVRPHDEPLSLSVRYAVEAFPGDHRLVSEAARLRTTELTEQQTAVHLQRIQHLLAQEIEQHLMTTVCAGKELALRASVIASIVSAALFAAMTHWSRVSGGQLTQLGPMVQEALSISDQGVLEALATANDRTSG
jgi:AcrR family transcriptional regulator